MTFGQSLGVACASFALTNIDDFFVLVTFMTEASVSSTMTFPRVVMGQYLGFTVIVAISLIGWGVAFAVPPEPIGFLGFVPIMLGTWKVIGLFISPEESEDSEDALGIKSILKVASITVGNGADNIGTYIPLFSQAKGSEIAIYIVTYYVLLALWCLATFLVMKQRHALHIARHYSHFFIPLLYIGLGIYIVVQSRCFPWSIGKIDTRLASLPGKLVMGIVTSALLSCSIAIMLWLRLKQRRSLASRSLAQSLEMSVERPVSLVGNS